MPNYRVVGRFEYTTVEVGECNEVVVADSEEDAEAKALVAACSGDWTDPVWSFGPPTVEKIEDLGRWLLEA